MQSILHNREDGCLICGNPYVEEHHVFIGTANRKLSDKYGLTVYLCAEHHRGNNGVHHNAGLDLKLKQMAQSRFEEVYPELDFIKIFGKNYRKD
jgi:hypothetical protein